MKRILSIAIAVLMLTMAFGAKTILADKPTDFDDQTGNALNSVGDTGFDEFGYNDTARIFSGTGASWCMAKGQLAECLGIYSPDKLVMKWNAEWDRGNAEGWTDSHYDAWLNNEWNGKGPGGSGSVWHYKFVWVGDCDADPTLVPDGGYCIWGQFATIMDQGVDPNAGPGHMWFAHANPTGYGAYPNP